MQQGDQAASAECGGVEGAEGHALEEGGVERRSFLQADDVWVTMQQERDELRELGGRTSTVDGEDPQGGREGGGGWVVGMAVRAGTRSFFLYYSISISPVGVCVCAHAKMQKHVSPRYPRNPALLERGR